MTDLTGIWESEIVEYTTPNKHTGELKITQTGTLVLSNSAPGWDLWVGYVEVLNGVEQLTAFFRNEGVPGTINAQVRSNGTLLMGIWRSFEPVFRTGGYLARRKVVPNEKPPK